MRSQLFDAQKIKFSNFLLVSLSVSLPILLGSASVLAITPSTQTASGVQIAAEPTTQPSEDPEIQTEPPNSDPKAKDDSKTPDPDTQTSNQPRFTCELETGKHTVMYHPQSQPGQSYAWAIPSAMGGGWSPERRCNEISKRLESYRPDGLEELRTGQENGYNTICVTTEKNPDCRIVLTIPAGEDPNMTRDRVFQNLTVADSGQSTQGVTTFVDGNDSNLLDKILGADSSSLGTRRNTRMRSDSIYLRPFLDRNDGGTGTRLRGGFSTRPNPRLNPDNFRN